MPQPSRGRQNALATLVCLLMTAARPGCWEQPEATISCRGPTLTVLPGTCVSFDNPCQEGVLPPESPGPWVIGDHFQPDQENQAWPSGVFLADPEVDVTLHVTRRICATADVAPVVGRRLAYKYAFEGEWGQGELVLTTARELQVIVQASSTDHVIHPGESIQLFPGIIGGVAPFAYQWSPASSLSSGTAQNPIATPQLTTTYTVLVSDATGNSGTGSITINVIGSVRATANPTFIDPGQSSQLVVEVTGGAPPYAYSWSPAGPLDNPLSPSPVASGLVNNTTFTVTVTDAAGISLSAQITVFVNMSVTVVAVPPVIAPGGRSQLIATAVGGQQPYTYTWSPPVDASGFVSPAATTTYQVIVDDSFISRVFGQVTVTVTP